MGSYKTIYQGGTGEVVEKKSRFIAGIVPVRTEEEARQFIERTRKRYWDAAHHCSAYVLGRENPAGHFSDDGEPSRTAGRPMLNVLLSEGITDAAAVVTRYFGGILLGTGGLVRAYTAAVKEGLKNSIIIEKKPAGLYLAATDYSGYGKLVHAAAGMEVKIVSTQYTDIVEAELAVPKERQQAFIKKIMEAAGGDIRLVKDRDIFYAEIQGETELFFE